MRRALIASAMLAAHAAVLPAQPITVDDLVARAGSYVGQFIASFSHMVAEERYVQESQGLPRVSRGARGLTNPAPVRREIKSDVLLVKTSDASDWMTFRDVYSVDGRLVRDRADRMARLFLAPGPDAVQAALAIEREGARYNLGNRARTINNPILALGFLQQRYQQRFDFSVNGTDTKFGRDVWILKYTERVRPTLLRTTDDRDMPASGRFWIEAGSGRVLKTELVVPGSDQVTTTFTFAPELDVCVPVDMRESYTSGLSTITGVASYSRFRQFTVSTDEAIGKD